MKAKKTKVTLYGDTIVEAVVAIAIYSIVAVLSLSLMSSGISTAQRNLESTMSRAVIDSESELLRYYYESYLASQSNKNDDARFQLEEVVVGLFHPLFSLFACAFLDGFNHLDSPRFCKR